MTSFQNDPVSAAVCESKLKSLLRAYKQASDNANRTGAGRSFVPFEKELDELFENRPIVSHNHTIGISGEPVVALPNNNSSNTSPLPSRSRAKRVEDYLERKLLLKKDFYDEKLKMQEQARADKERRHKEKMDFLSKLINK